MRTRINFLADESETHRDIRIKSGRNRTVESTLSVYRNIKKRVEKENYIMKDYNFGCPACSEKFSLLLPEKIKLAAFFECSNNEHNRHNLVANTHCNSCQMSILVYYCTDGHR